MKAKPFLSTSLIAIFLILTLFIFYAGFSQEAYPISVYYFHDCDPSQLPLYTALENGYFKTEKIDVTLSWSIDVDVNIQNVAEHPDIDLIVVGRAQFYNLEDKYPDLFNVFNFNVQDGTRWNDAVVVKKDSEIKSLGQLRGKTIGIITDGSNWGARGEIIKIILEKNGLNPEDFKIMITTMNDFENNQVDALYMRGPLLSLFLYLGKTMILEEGPIFAKYIFGPWPMSVSALSSKIIKESPDVAERVVRVWDRAINYIRENPVEADEILQRCMEKTFGVKDLPVRRLNYWTSKEINQTLIQNQLDWYYSKGFLSRKLNVADILSG